MKKVNIKRYECPYCHKENVTKIKEPKQCPQCHRKFASKKPIIIKEVVV